MADHHVHQKSEASVIGRMMKVETNSIGVTMMYTGHGTPDGKSEFLKKFLGPS